MDCLAQIECSMCVPAKSCNNHIKIILDGENVIVGTKTHPNLSKFKTIAPEHASFYKEKGKWYVENLDHLHNTIINSKKLGTVVVMLKYDDVIEFSDNSLRDGLICKFIREKNCNLTNTNYGEKANFETSNKLVVGKHKSVAAKQERNYVSKQAKHSVMHDKDISESRTVSQAANHSGVEHRENCESGFQSEDDDSVHSDASVRSEDRIIIPSKYKLQTDNLKERDENSTNGKKAKDFFISNSSMKETASKDTCATMNNRKFHKQKSTREENHNVLKKKVSSSRTCMLGDAVAKMPLKASKSLCIDTTKTKNNSINKSFTEINYNKGLIKANLSKKCKKRRVKFAENPNSGPHSGSKCAKSDISLNPENNRQTFTCNSNINQAHINNSKIIKSDTERIENTYAVQNNSIPNHLEHLKTFDSIDRKQHAKKNTMKRKNKFSDNELSVKSKINKYLSETSGAKSTMTNTAMQSVPIHPNASTQRYSREKIVNVPSTVSDSTKHKSLSKIANQPENVSKYKNYTSTNSSIQANKIRNVSSERDILQTTLSPLPDIDHVNCESHQPSAEVIDMGPFSKRKIAGACNISNVENIPQLPSKSSLSIAEETSLQISHRGSRVSSQNYGMFDLIKKIVYMNTNWLQEQKKFPHPPEDLTEGAAVLPLAFETYNSYKRQFFLIIILAMWEEIFLNSRPILENSMFYKFEFSVIANPECTNEFLILKCRSEMNADSSFTFRPMSVVILHLNQTDGSLKDTFGFITAVEKCHSDAESPNSRYSGSKMGWIIDIYIKYRELDIVQNRIITANYICSLETEVKYFQRLINIEMSPLLSDILTPKTNTFVFNPVAKYSPLVPSNVISDMCSEMMTNPQSAKIILLYGPPGSGKTTAVTRIVENIILSNESNVKILITCPSYVALDEIGNWLINIKKSKAKSLIFTRYGKKRYISSQMLPYSLKSSWQEYSKYSENNDVNRIQSDLADYDKSSKNFKEGINKRRKTLSTRPDYDEYMRASLMKSQVVLIALDECDQLLKFGVQFSFCIVEESHHANELETLAAFTLQINKFIIVGDPIEIPMSENSALAIKYEYQRSLFRRFKSYFLENNLECPGVILSKPIRMHPQIAHFPYKHFYCNIIDPSSKASNTNGFNPFLVFNRKVDNMSEDFINVGISSVVYMCSYILKHFENKTIGVIVPSQTEVDAYNSAIGNKLSLSKIEINTVDKFYGRHKPIIILSVFNQNNLKPADFYTNEQILSVALTRAIDCLIIHGYISNIEHYPGWNNLNFDSMIRNCLISYNPENNFEIIFENKFKKDSVSDVTNACSIEY